MKPKKQLPSIIRLFLFIPLVGMIICWHHMTTTDQWEWDEPSQTVLPIAVVTHFGYYLVLTIHFIYMYVAVLPFR